MAAHTRSIGLPIIVFAMAACSGAPETQAEVSALTSGTPSAPQTSPATTTATTPPTVTTAPNTTTAKTTTVPSTTAPARTVPAPVVVTTADLPEFPPYDRGLEMAIPVIDGYSTARVTADEPFWSMDAQAVPSGLTTHHANVLDADGTPVGRLIVVDSTDWSAIDAVVEHTFATFVMLPASAVENGGQTLIISHSAIPFWIGIDGFAVIGAVQEIDLTMQWLWATEDHVWIVRGSDRTDDYVHKLLGTVGEPLGPFDQQGMNGDLYYMPDIPGYVYGDLPRDFSLGEIHNSPLKPCVERFYVGYIRPKTASPTDPYDEDDLTVTLARLAGSCIDAGSLDLFAENVANTPGARAEEIAGWTVYRTENSIRVMIDDVLIVFSAINPEIIDSMKPFITEFLASQEF